MLNIPELLFVMCQSIIKRFNTVVMLKKSKHDQINRCSVCLMVVDAYVIFTSIARFLFPFISALLIVVQGNGVTCWHKA